MLLCPRALSSTGVMHAAPAGPPLLAAPKHSTVLSCTDMQEGFAPATASPRLSLRGLDQHICKTEEEQTTARARSIM